MLADPRSAVAGHELRVPVAERGKIDNIQPDPTLYPDFDPDLRAGFREEIRLFLDSVLRADRSVLDLLRSDDTFLNERLARAVRRAERARRAVPRRCASPIRTAWACSARARC